MAHILVIDDDEMARSMLRSILETENHTIIEAADGSDGIACHRQQPADLIITDIHMPEKDGFATIHELRQEFPGIKIIAVTGYGLHNLPIAYDLGAVRVFEKPFSVTDILAAVRELLGANG